MQKAKEQERLNGKLGTNAKDWRDFCSFVSNFEKDFKKEQSKEKPFTPQSYNRGIAMLDAFRQAFAMKFDHLYKTPTEPELLIRHAPHAIFQNLNDLLKNYYSCFSASPGKISGFVKATAEDLSELQTYGKIMATISRLLYNINVAKQSSLPREKRNANLEYAYSDSKELISLLEKFYNYDKSDKTHELLEQSKRLLGLNCLGSVPIHAKELHLVYLDDIYSTDALVQDLYLGMLGLRSKRLPENEILHEVPRKIKPQKDFKSA